MAPAIVNDVTASNSLPNKTTPQTTNNTTQTVLKTPLPNPSLQVTVDHSLKQQEAPIYAPAQGEILLHIKATGVCGYDVPFHRSSRRTLTHHIAPISTSGKQVE
jgi:L-iditol 2-dehydrogenase